MSPDKVAAVTKALGHTKELVFEEEEPGGLMGVRESNQERDQTTLIVRGSHPGPAPAGPRDKSHHP